MDIFIAILCITLIGAILSGILVLVSHFMDVPQDETQTNIREVLPGVNCGACGYTGCDGYAKALADHTETKVNLCVPGADKVSSDIANILGVEAEDVIEKVAFVHCLGDCDHCTDKCEYEGIESCTAANALYSGQSSCSDGCLGFGDCAKVCPVDAICVENGIAHVDSRKCIGCGLCEKTCPNRLITLFSDNHKVAVTCSNHDKGAVIRKNCTNGCIACKKCENACPNDAIKVINNLAQIDYDKCSGCGICTQVCPVGCITKKDFTGKHNID